MISIEVRLLTHLYDTRNSEKTQPGMYLGQEIPPIYYGYFKEEITKLRRKRSA